MPIYLKLPEIIMISIKKPFFNNLIYFILIATCDISIRVHNPFLFLGFLPFISPFHLRRCHLLPALPWGTTLHNPLPNAPAAAAEATGEGGLPGGRTYSVSSSLFTPCRLRFPRRVGEPYQSQIHLLIFAHFWVLDWFHDQFINPSPFNLL